VGPKGTGGGYHEGRKKTTPEGRGGEKRKQKGSGGRTSYLQEEIEEGKPRGTKSPSMEEKRSQISSAL